MGKEGRAFKQQEIISSFFLHCTLLMVLFCFLRTLTLLWFEFPASSKGGITWAFLSACPVVEQKGKGKWWGFQSQILTRESDSLLLSPRAEIIWDFSSILLVTIFSMYIFWIKQECDWFFAHYHFLCLTSYSFLGSFYISPAYIFFLRWFVDDKVTEY